MINCTHCGKTQAEGNFCEACGAKLTIETEQPKTEEPNQALLQQEAPAANSTSKDGKPLLDQVQTTSKQYWTYATTRLKQPNCALKDNEQSLTNAIITAILLAFAVSLFFFGILHTWWNDNLAGWTDGKLPFFSTMGRLLLVFIPLIFSGLLANFITFRIVKDTLSLKQQFIRHFGTLVPMTALFVVMALLSLLGIFKMDIFEVEANLWGSLFIFLLLGIIIVIIPLIHMLYVLINQQHKQSFYVGILSVIINALLIAIFMRIFISNTLQEMERLL
ncbi:hypothetical protein [Gracilibacillus alcaliphilus]|uniref:hypothetical protein n=1 Tax=Gracilibacillus alcaliphilus TaxID=1401441 RepID=UPI001959CD2B|nr:hypothetical protein [Gracilibacillus alcaliphilus]MBM7677135.1 MFS family permease [Gracilibacillus alcaliphilus]